MHANLLWPVIDRHGVRDAIATEKIGRSDVYTKYAIPVGDLDVKHACARDGAGVVD
ncbi:MAG: hypothetical protein MUP90_12230 [Gammaproteobacteria bacterium]|nr:hypothetical protein [Gammaproteobacteria bacterium]